MRRSTLTLTGCVVAALGAALAFAARPAADEAYPPKPAEPARRLVVHEWGTFTGLAGSDGRFLPVRTSVGGDLPGFVDTRSRDALRRHGDRAHVLLFTKENYLAAVQRMETPVVYFYADRTTEVNVRVDFRAGMLTEFYPPVRDLGPTFGDGPGEPRLVPFSRPATGPATQPATAEYFAALEGAGPRNDSKVYHDSFLDWGKVRIVPRSAGGAGGAVPPVTDGNHYAEARNTDADLVRWTAPDGKVHDERFLFYRGLGDFTLPVTLRALGGERFELTNAGPDPLRTAFLIEADGAGEPTRFVRYENVAGSRELKLPPADAVPSGPGLGEAIVAALVAEGLYEKEARAMVATWRSQWLGEPGVRVLYTLPGPATDALLPLRVTPAPTETVRVLVGRIDVLTPEREVEIAALLRTAATMRKIPDEGARMLTGLGRFTDPAIDRVARLGGAGTSADDAPVLRAALRTWQAEQRAAKEKAAAASR